jgi:hypothetical protein
VSKYRAEIKALSGSTVGAVIIRISNGETCGWELFSSFFNTHKSVENNFKRAHQWVNKRIEILDRYEEA